VVDVSANSYRVTHASPDDDAYTIKITVSDGTNSTVVGTDVISSGTIKYEVDSSVAAPTSIPADDGSIAQAEPLFVTVTYTGEGSEYGAADDTHDTVTITAATLGTVDVLTSLSTDNNILMEFALAGVAVGDHTLSVTAQDAAGNTLTTAIDFTVTARADYTVDLNAGWNLISFPADPANTSIDSVIPSTHPASQVLTYDPGHADGPWLVAVRGTNNAWTGTLTTIDSSHAYWVSSPSSVDIEALLSLQSEGGTLLPTISVITGWNLLPVVDLTQTAVGTDSAAADAWETDASEYFTTISWKVAYGFVDGGWVRITSSNVCSSAADAGCLVNGLGYWVWVTANGTLVP